MKKINKLFLFGITFLAFAFASCNLGLGEAVDLTGPDVTLIQPTMRQNVSKNFTISGTAYDNNRVKTLTVSIDSLDADKPKQHIEWKNENGEWTFKANGSSDYVPYADSKWQEDENKKVTWEINNINITSGMQMVTVIAVDSAGNTSAESRKSVTIQFDNEPPKVTITIPNIKYTDFEGTNGIKTKYSAVGDCKQLQIVNNVITGAFTVSGITKDDSKVNYVRLFVKKVDEATGEATDFIEKNLVLEDCDLNIQNQITQETLRSWSAEITKEDLASLDDGKHYLQIATQASDNAENKTAGIDIHGYVLLWKEANKPWVEINLSSTKAEATKVYSGASAQGTAFDNVQVAKITLTINKYNGSEWEPISDDYSKKEIEIKYDKDDLSQTSTFKFNYPSDVNNYQVVLKATDTEGNESEEVTSYIDVQDMSFPSVKAEVKNQNILPFGNAAGNITINVIALDDTEVKVVKYKLCTDDVDKANYSDKAYPGWSGATNITNKFTQNGTETDEGGYVRKKYESSDFTLNLFTDLKVAMSGTGKRKLEQTTIIFYVEDGQENKSVTKFVLPADITPPKVTLTKVDNTELNADGSFKNNITAFPLFKNNFIISGTWWDDSFDVWKSNDTDKMPKLTVKVRGNSVTDVSMNSNGTWNATVPLSYVQNTGGTAVVGAMDIEVSITDIGGSTTTFQKGYQIDTDAPKIEYVTCNKASGTYPNGTVFDITLNFNREVTVSGTPTLTLSNGKTADFYSGSKTKKLVFRYTVTGSGNDTNSLIITGGSYNSGSITTKTGSLSYAETDFNAEVKNDDNKAMGKEIKILTSTPAYKSHTWTEGTNPTLTLVFDGLVTANDGDVEIEQITVLAPAYLTKDEYNDTSAAVKAYYKEGTLGASSAFVSDLTTKYILDYDKDLDDSAVVKAYTDTGAHKRSVNIRSSSVTSSSQDTTANTTTFTIVFEELPCKGATYKLNIPAGLVKNDAGTTNAASSTESDQIKKSGIEPPVIRIKKSGQDIKNYNATQQLTTTFKVDCRTPGASVSYTYDAYTSGSYLVTRGAQQFKPENNYDNIQEEIEMDFDYTAPNGTTHIYKTTEKKGATRNGHTYASGGKPASTFTKQSSSSGTTSGTIGTDDYADGLKYEIKATASKTGAPSVDSYEVAYRTTIAFKNFYHLEKDNSGSIKTNATNWPYNSSGTTNLRMFIRGSDNEEGANTTKGLPCSWDINDPTSIAMLSSTSATGNDINYYFTTWSITVDKFYFKFLAGLCDNQTNTDENGVSQGPQYSRYCSEGLWFRSPEFPVGKGEYLILDDTHTDRYGVAFMSAVPSMQHR